MKKLILFSAIALLTFTTFSCSADDDDSATKTTEVKKEINHEIPKYAGPGDIPNTPPPPPETE
ncbi:hypothetical protein CLU81_1260 [Flavobacterium sp. 9]|uniref:hypothetical protein n=1 Tax=Flavobacterium sp. 9 TaxID=2035198 RepID=UPI000C17CB33|nr:hypothetical protein [Flavobacterium sp. 9]PIF30810.1 hypothetical protein CLU81_1260 [Flavobacterium sp. 9]